MIKKIVVAMALIAVSMVHCIAQTDDETTKKYDQYIGLQANDLLKQLLNLNVNSTEITNPYLLTYYIQNAKCGWGINIGLGYNYQDTKAVNTTSPQETKINDLDLRVGLGKRCMIGKRFEIGCSLDFVISNQTDQTSTTTVNITNNGSGNVIDSTFAVSTSKVTSSGFGPQLFLGFHISKRVILGTEATYYFMMSKQKLNNNVTDRTTDQAVVPNTTTSNISNTNVENDGTTFSFSKPVAIFLIIKF